MPTTSRRSTMPAIILTRAPTRSASPSSPKLGVAFPKNPVQGISRPLNQSESHVLYEFEYHAQRCRACRDPYDVCKKGHQLCEAGHELAQTVAMYLYDKDGETYSAREGSSTVHVEIPHGYDEVRSLLKAIERSLRHRTRSPFISMDRSYHILTREPSKPTRKSSVKVSQPKPRRRDSIVEWPEEQQQPRSILVTKTPNASKRGSLYESDLAQQRRDYAKYNVELREPTNRSSGYHR